jgi:NAD(P)H-dependent flavin oxidoreductase YrpB (nitropropane dioxygenase family)
MVLTPEIVDIAGNIPVLAAGGIASGLQLAAAPALGAAREWAGSIWLSSFEDMTGSAVKEKYLDATSSATLRSSTRTGKPARQLPVPGTRNGRRQARGRRCRCRSS